MKRILAFTNSKDATVDVVEKATLDVQIIRFDTDKTSSSKIYFDSMGKNSMIPCDVVWYRRPFDTESSPKNVESLVLKYEWDENVWNYLLQYPENKWINYPTKNWYADRKIIQLKRAPYFGLQVPHWILTSKRTEISNFLKINGDSLIKPLSSGYIPFKNNLYHIYSSKIDDNIDLKFSKNCPTLVQKIIDKDFDVRTLYVDGEILFFKLKSDCLDVRENNMKNVKYDLIEPSKRLRLLYKKFVKSFGLRFCTSDFVVDKKGKWFFLENNANGNWAWLEEFFPGLVINHFLKSIKC